MAELFLINGFNDRLYFGEKDSDGDVKLTLNGEYTRIRVEDALKIIAHLNTQFNIK